jgi:nicotinate-nucleotide adenylyltransferase
MRDIGVIGGTFDPVHSGHLKVAEEARTRLELGEVLFVPAGQPWLKEPRSISPAPHRLEMLRLALGPTPYFRLSAGDIDRPGPTYSVDTIADLREQLGVEAGLFFILGWDCVAEFPLWKDAARIVEMCYLVAVPRPGSALPDMALLEASLPGISGRLTLLNMPPLDISSTDIRDRVAHGLSIHNLVPRAVERYIREKGLYLRYPGS